MLPKTRWTSPIAYDPIPKRDRVFASPFHFLHTVPHIPPSARCKSKGGGGGGGGGGVSCPRLARHLIARTSHDSSQSLSKKSVNFTFLYYTPSDLSPKSILISDKLSTRFVFSF